jgi:uncharacterized membrane protein YkvA (DUF1232 family)
VTESDGKDSFGARLRARAKALKAEVDALGLAYRDPRTPWYAKAFVALVVAYALSPLDLIPDFVPVLGYLDDLILVPLGIALALRMIPADVMTECRAAAAQRDGRKRSWAGGALIVVVWASLMLLSIALVLRVAGAR